MKSQLVRIFIGCFIVGLSHSVLAQFNNGDPDRNTITKVGTTSAQFMKLGVGARAVALGGTFVAEANDLSSLYWNPAGLPTISGSAVQLAHTEYLADVQFEYAAFGMNLGNAGSIGASITYLDSGEMPVRTVYEPEGTGERFSAQDFALQVTYGRQLTDRFSIGASGKYIQETIWHSTASSIALDLGVLFTTPYDKLKLGASISNFGPKMKMEGRDIYFAQDPDLDGQGNVEIVNSAFLLDSYSLPLIFRVGLAWDAVNTADHRILVTTDAAHPNDNSQYINVGTEYSFRDLIALRAGYKNLFEVDGEQGLTFGGGLNLRMDGTLRAQIDYAYATFGRLEQTHWFTFNLNF